MASVTQAVDVTRLISFGKVAGLHLCFFHKAGQVVCIAVIFLLAIIEII